MVTLVESRFTPTSQRGKLRKPTGSREEKEREIYPFIDLQFFVLYRQPLDWTQPSRSSNSSSFIMSPMVIPASPVVLEPIQAAPLAQKSVSTSTSTISSEQPSACAKTLNNQLTTSWKPIKAAELVQRLVNPIRDVVSAIDLSGSDVGGKSFLNLGLGDPSVFGNLPPPPAALNAIVGAVVNGTADGYPQSVGYDDTRTAVADYFDSDDWKVQKRDVVMTLGASGALEMAFAITADAGKNVLLPRPL
jgi:hypothetical protein